MPRRLRYAPLVVFAVTPFLGLACQEKMGVEKRAEDIAKSAAIDAGAPDTGLEALEAKYRARQKALEESVTNMKADEGHVMAKDPVATPGILRHYFEPGDEGDKAAAALEAKRKKDGGEGYRIVSAKIRATNIGETQDDGQVDVDEETIAKSNSVCLRYSQHWVFHDDRWFFKENKSIMKVDCEK